MKNLMIGIFVLIAAVSIKNVLSGEEIGQGTIENFSLMDYKGKDYQLSDFKNAKAIVIMFISTRCPVSNAYNERLVSLYQEYSQKNIVFLGIYSNRKETIKDIETHVNKNGFLFPALRDSQNVVADKFEAQVTPEVFVLNSAFKLLYHGRIDDSQRIAYVKRQDLLSALNQILTGQLTENFVTKAFGCSIKRMSITDK